MISVVKLIYVFSLTAVVAFAESNPSWWNLASPDATALVGIQWENVKHSVFAEAVGAELSASGTLGFPDLLCLKAAKQILISSPEMLAIANGAFPSAAVREEASAKGWKAATYRGIELWITPGKEDLSIARLSDQLLLIGLRKTLLSTIDRSLTDDGPADAERHYTPLLARAARFAHTKDLWVVANQLPDDLANRFVPLDVEAVDFQGGISLQDGLHLEAALDADSEASATAIADKIRDSIANLPGIARSLQVTVASRIVAFGLQVSRQELAESLRQKNNVAIKTPPPEPVSPEPAGPQVIRIFGLDGGPREIPLPSPAKPF